MHCSAERTEIEVFGGLTQAKTFKSILAILICIGLAPAAVSQQSYFVTNDLSSGIGSLRAAIDSVNASGNDVPTPDTIKFNMSDTATMIELDSDLPAITRPVFVDGLSQPGSVCAALLDTSGSYPVLGEDTPSIMVVLKGDVNTINGITLNAGSDGSTIQGIAFQNLAIPLRIEGSDFHSVQCNFFGFDTNGLDPEPNNGLNISLEDAEECIISNNLIGASSDILAGDLAASIVIGDENSFNVSSSNLITANIIGGNVLGNDEGLQKTGVLLRTGQSTIIRQNLISYNKENGISASGSNGSVCSSNSFHNNGIDVTDLVGTHIAITAFFSPASGYIIEENKILETNTDSLNTAGVLLLAFFQPVSDITIAGNDISGTTSGVIAGTVNSIVTDVEISNNTIYHQKGLGIALSPSTEAISIRSNSIYDNGGLAIGLSVSDGAILPTPNDEGDTDTGANSLQNYPVIDSAIIANDSVEIFGSISTSANCELILDFYANLVCNPNAEGIEETDPDLQYGEGKTLLGSVEMSTDTSAQATFQVKFPMTDGPQFVITATATSLSGTSEFSRCTEAMINNLTVVNTDDSGYGSLRYALEHIRAGGTVDFSPEINGDTIRIISSVFELTNNISILGNGVGSTIIDAAELDRALVIPPSLQTSIANVTILGGSDPESAGILNHGVLNLRDVELVDTSPLSQPALIYCTSSAQLTVTGQVDLRRLD